MDDLTRPTGWPGALTGPEERTSATHGTASDDISIRLRLRLRLQLLLQDGAARSCAARRALHSVRYGCSALRRHMYAAAAAAAGACNGVFFVCAWRRYGGNLSATNDAVTIVCAYRGRSSSLLLLLSLPVTRLIHTGKLRRRWTTGEKRVKILAAGGCHICHVIITDGPWQVVVYGLALCRQYATASEWCCVQRWFKLTAYL